MMSEKRYCAMPNRETVGLWICSTDAAGMPMRQILQRQFMTNNILRFFIDRTETPIGELIAVSDVQGNLCAIDWTEYENRMQRLLQRYYGANAFTLLPMRNPHGLTTALESYFAGDLAAIQKLPVRTTGTAFQQSVWNALRQIPCGATTSYAEIARAIGRSEAVRAVGLANGANPVGVVVPCHRVIGSDGSLTGYGGGLERKRWLLAHEGAITRQMPGLETSPAKSNFAVA
jgi:methylated-DNA-[protein]-cysteine S-methyltransferase